MLNELLRFALNGSETGPERFMPSHNLTQAFLQRLNAERAVDLHDSGNIVGRISRLKLMKQPKAALRKGNGRHKSLRRFSARRRHIFDPPTRTGQTWPQAPR